MFNAIKGFFAEARDRNDRAYYDRMSRRLPVQIKRVSLARGAQIIKNFTYDHIVCPDSAGYLALEADGPNLKLKGICETDYRGPRVKDAVFINGEPVRPFGLGQCAEISLPRNAEITFLGGDFVVQGRRTVFVPCIVRVVPFAAAVAA